MRKETQKIIDYDNKQLAILKIKMKNLELFFYIGMFLIIFLEINFFITQFYLGLFLNAICGVLFMNANISLQNINYEKQRKLMKKNFENNLYGFN